MKSKLLVVVAALTLTTVNAVADQMPVQWQLPDGGKSCALVARFGDRSVCGASAFETWSCIENGALAQYLVVGKMTSDVLGECQPTFQITNIVRAL